jgi:hypothetical protein
MAASVATAPVASKETKVKSSSGYVQPSAASAKGRYAEENGQLPGDTRVVDNQRRVGAD